MKNLRRDSTLISFFILKKSIIRRYQKLPTTALVFILSALAQFNLTAQHVGLTVNPGDWVDLKPNLGLQLSYPAFSWVAVYGDVTMFKSVYETDDLHNVYSGHTTGLEMRLFPFGGCSHLRLKSLDDVSLFKKKPTGCNTFARVKKSPFSLLGGVYVAPGLEWQRYELTSTARIFGKDITNNYDIQSTGLSLHLGYVFSFEHITLGASYGFYVLQPSIRSTSETIPEMLEPKTNVWGLSSKRGLRLSAGVSF